VLVGTYTSVFIAAPVLIYLGVGTSRIATEEEKPRTNASPARTRA
jgi:preprotein translocase subunit SecF